MNSELSQHKTRRLNPRCFLLAIGVWAVGSVILSFPAVRAVLARPLYVHDSGARGEVAYVMADGFAYWQRLRAASNLYNMKRVDRILLLDEKELTGYNFVLQRNRTVVEEAIAFLEWHGVPADKISTVSVGEDPLLGSLSEAKAVAAAYPNLKRLVVVTSAMHTRRAGLCFRRSCPDDVRIDVYSASTPRQSWDIRSPIWIECAKLALYFVVA